MQMTENEAPALAELFSDTPREARRAYKEPGLLGPVRLLPAKRVRVRI